MSTVTERTARAFIDGEQLPIGGGETMTIVDPGTGRQVGVVGAADQGTVDTAVAAARAAFHDWSRRGVAERGELLVAASRALTARVDDLIDLLVAEQGKTRREARIELSKAADTLLHYGELGRGVRGSSVYGLAAGVEGRVLRRPLGVVAAIVPWNFPTTLLCNKLGPALLTGNTVVAKPADTTPFTTLELDSVLTAARIPDGVFNVVPGSGPVAGEALVTHPDVDKVAFTGSTPTGERVMALAAAGVKRVTLELGGSDPLIVCDDADVARAASAAAMGRFYNCGQACLATKRVYVFEQVADQLIDAVTEKAGRLRVGLGTDPQAQLGPLHSEGQLNLLERQIAESVADGGEVLVGGGRPDDPELAQGWFHEPTVVLEPPHDSPLATEEVFGPALPIWRVADLDEAIERANASQFGLGSAIWTADLNRAQRAAAELECGYTWVNSPTKVYDELPFGGIKRSGIGKEHGFEALDAYTDLKSVVVRTI